MVDPTPVQTLTPVSTVQPTPEPPPQEPAPPVDGDRFIDPRTASPEEIDARIRRLYGGMKHYERTAEQLAEQNKTLLAELEKIRNTSFQQTQTSERATLLDRIRQAKETGNVVEEVRLMDALTQLGARQPERIAMPQVDLPNTDALTVRSWTLETNQDGTFRRPWAIEGHPLYQTAYQLTAQLKDHPSFTQNVDGLLGEVERQMGQLMGAPAQPASPAPQPLVPRYPTVLPQGTMPRPGANQSILTPDQMEVARKMNLSPEAYLKQHQAALENDPRYRYRVQGR